MEQAHGAAAGIPDGVMVLERWSTDKRTKKQWPISLKKELVMRLLRGEPVRGVSREMAVPEYKLERWRNCALVGIDSALRERETDSLATCLEDAYRRIDELAREIETLRKRRRTKRPSPAVGGAAAAVSPSS